MPKGFPTRTGRLLTAEDRTKILEEANEPGCNRSALADKWGVSRTFIYLLLNPAAFASPKPIDLIGAHEIAKLRKTLRLSLRQFADLLGITEKVVRDWEAGEYSPRAASRHRLLEIAKEHGLPLEFLVSEMSVKAAGVTVQNPLGYQERRNLKEKGKQRQDFRRRIVEPPPVPVQSQAPPPKTVTVGNRAAFDSAKGIFG
jgi:DNA-binding transcriptional regulator YiaG